MCCLTYANFTVLLQFSARIALHRKCLVSLLHLSVILSTRILQLRSTVHTNWTERMLAKFHLPNIFKEDVPGSPPDYFTTTFQGDKMHKYVLCLPTFNCFFVMNCLYFPIFCFGYDSFEFIR